VDLGPAPTLTIRTHAIQKAGKEYREKMSRHPARLRDMFPIRPEDNESRGSGEYEIYPALRCDPEIYRGKSCIRPYLEIDRIF